MAIKTKATIRVIALLLLLFCSPPNIMGQLKITKGALKSLKKYLPITTGKGLSKFPPYVPIVSPPQLPPTNSGFLLGIFSRQDANLPKRESALTVMEIIKAGELNHRNRNINILDAKPWCVDRERLKSVFDALIIAHNTSIPFRGTWRVIGWQNEIVPQNDYAKKFDEYIMISPESGFSYMFGAREVSHYENSDLGYKTLQHKDEMALHVHFGNSKRVLLLEPIIEDNIPASVIDLTIGWRQTTKNEISANPEQIYQHSFDATITTILQEKNSEAKSKASWLLSPEYDKRWFELGNEIEELGIRLGLEKKMKLLFNKGMKFDFKKKNDPIGFNNYNYGYEYELYAA